MDCSDCCGNVAFRKLEILCGSVSSCSLYQLPFSQKLSFGKTECREVVLEIIVLAVRTV